MSECIAPTLSGEPCRAKPQTNSSFCFMHDPSKLLERSSARRRGGFAAHRIDGRPPKPHPVHTAEAIQALLSQAAGDVMSRKPSIARARALCYVAQTAFRALELTALEERLTALESALKPRLSA